MKRLLLALGAAALASGCLQREVVSPPAVTLTLTRGSTIVTRRLSVKELEGYGVGPAATTWPFGAGDYQGVQVQAILDAARLGGDANYVIFNCADGYSAYIPVGFFKRYPAALVTRYNGRPPEDWKEHDGKPVGLYLGLPNAAYPELDQPRFNAYWPYQIVGIETARLYNRLAPAPAGARAGQELFLQQCIHCHTLNGTGGLKGPDLTGVAKRVNASAFAAYVKSPSVTRPGTWMPAFGTFLSDADLKSLYDYLSSAGAP